MPHHLTSVIFPSFVFQNFPALTSVCPTHNLSLQGCCCYLYDLNILFMHKQDGAHSAKRLEPLLFSAPLQPLRATLMKSPGDTAETAVGTAEH